MKAVQGMPHKEKSSECVMFFFSSRATVGVHIFFRWFLVLPLEDLYLAQHQTLKKNEVQPDQQCHGLGI